MNRLAGLLQLENGHALYYTLNMHDITLACKTYGKKKHLNLKTNTKNNTDKSNELGIYKLKFSNFPEFYIGRSFNYSLIDHHDHSKNVSKNMSSNQNSMHIILYLLNMYYNKIIITLKTANRI